MINDLKNSGEWKSHVTMRRNVMLSKDSDEKHLMHSKIDNKETMTGFNTKDLTEELSEMLLVD